ncbi:unknown [Prevotella sp. CAG:1031]|nr:unknown [Prevotella sp. CAG:1031]
MDIVFCPGNVVEQGGEHLGAGREHFDDVAVGIVCADERPSELYVLPSFGPEKLLGIGAAARFVAAFEKPAAVSPRNHVYVLEAAPEEYV